MARRLGVNELTAWLAEGRDPVSLLADGPDRAITPQLDFRDAHLTRHSWGGQIVQRAVLDHPRTGCAGSRCCAPARRHFRPSRTPPPCAPAWPTGGVARWFTADELHGPDPLVETIRAQLHRADLHARAAALAVGFPLAMAVTAGTTLVFDATGLLTTGALDRLDLVDFIYEVGPFSLIVAMLAGVAGMLALTSAKSASLVRVFISVTTVPAAAFASVALVEHRVDEALSSALQLL